MSIMHRQGRWKQCCVRCGGQGSALSEGTCDGSLERGSEGGTMRTTQRGVLEPWRERRQPAVMESCVAGE